MIDIGITQILRRHATRWEAGGAAAPPDFGGSVNPISTRGDTLSPPSTTCPPGFLTLVACLYRDVIGSHQFEKPIIESVQSIDRSDFSPITK